MSNILSSVVVASHLATTAGFHVTSPDVHQGKPLALTQVGNQFGCTGENLSPTLEFRNLPEGTRSLAVTVYDLDAPTGTGWWHWLVVDIPASHKVLPAGIGVKSQLPGGARQPKNDAGAADYTGACPPPGNPHRYVFTAYALKVDKLPITADATPNFVTFMLNMNALAKATLTATYGR